MAPLNVAIIGYGLSAKIFHIPFILALPNEYKLYGILQRTPTAANNASHEHAGIKTWKDIDTMLSDPAIDIVIVTSIPSSHYALVISCLQANKHVICEKPFVPTSAEAVELGALATKHGKVLAVYQNRRWDADFVTLSSILADGNLGSISEFESHFDRHRPILPAPKIGEKAAVGWKMQDLPCAGAIYDLGSHLLDQFVALFGEPERVTAFIGNQRAKGMETPGGDSFTVLLHYDERNMLATAKAGVVSAEMQQLRFWVRGTKGTFRKNQLDMQEDQLKRGMRPGDEGFGVEDKDVNGVLTVVEPDTGAPFVTRSAPEMPPRTYATFHAAVARAVRGAGPNPVSAEENAKVLRIIEAAIQSSKEERTVRLAK